jgi:hypothetical protein
MGLVAEPNQPSSSLSLSRCVHFEIAPTRRIPHPLGVSIPTRRHIAYPRWLHPPPTPPPLLTRAVARDLRTLWISQRARQARARWISRRGPPRPCVQRGSLRELQPAAALDATRQRGCVFPSPSGGVRGASVGSAKLQRGAEQRAAGGTTSRRSGSRHPRSAAAASTGVPSWRRQAFLLPRRRLYLVTDVPSCRPALFADPRAMRQASPFAAVACSRLAGPLRRSGLARGDCCTAVVGMQVFCTRPPHCTH